MPQTQNWQPATLAAALGVPEEAFRAFARLRQIAWEKELSPPEAASLALAWVAADRAAFDAEDKLDLYGLQALAMRAVVESGECFIRLLTVPTSPRNPIVLSLQVLESDHLDTARNGVVDGAPTIQGIALGSAGVQLSTHAGDPPHACGCAAVIVARLGQRLEYGSATAKRCAPFSDGLAVLRHESRPRRTKLPVQQIRKAVVRRVWRTRVVECSQNIASSNLRDG